MKRCSPNFRGTYEFDIIPRALSSNSHDMQHDVFSPLQRAPPQGRKPVSAHLLAPIDANMAHQTPQQRRPKAGTASVDKATTEERVSPAKRASPDPKSPDSAKR
eukprot:scaffold677857_cov38-Prasinocladus_malaysianus.AAC.1